MGNTKLIDEVTILIKKYVPQWGVVAKKKSILHRILSFLPPLIFSRHSYMNRYWTTIGFTAFYPIGGENEWYVCAHEGVHGMQAKRWTRFLFGFLYLFPQSFFLPLGLGLAFFINPWFLLIALLGILPLPAPFRMLWELEAYCVSVMVEEWCWGTEETNEYIDRIVSNYFSGFAYYFMWPFPKKIRSTLKKAQELAASWSPERKGPHYVSELYMLLLANGRVKK